MREVRTSEIPVKPDSLVMMVSQVDGFGARTVPKEGEG